MQMARQVDTLGDQEQHGHAQAAEDLEVDPDALVGERNEQVGRAAEQEECDPRQVQARPHRLGQGQRMAHDALDQQAVADGLFEGMQQYFRRNPPAGSYVAWQEEQKRLNEALV